MPKALSLKKPQGSASKNQMCISDFLKNNSQKGPVVARTQSPTKGTENSIGSSKRKASSPILVDSLDKNGQFKTETNSPKKIKTEHNRKSPLSLKKNSPKKKSPNKENMNKSFTLKKKLFSVLDGCNQNGLKTQSCTTTLKKEEKSFAITDINNIKNLNVFDVGLNHESCVSGLDIKPSCTQSTVTDKQLLYKNGIKNVSSSQKQSTPRKSPLTEFRCSPINEFSTPEKDLKIILTPSKKGSTVKALDFSPEQVCDDFGDEWDIDDMEDGTEDLDLSIMQPQSCINY